MVAGPRCRGRAEQEAHQSACSAGIADATRDLYGQAFALLGFAWYHRLTGDREVLKVADTILAFLDRDLDHDAEEFIVSWSRELPRSDSLELVIHLSTSPDVERLNES